MSVCIINIKRKRKNKYLGGKTQITQIEAEPRLVNQLWLNLTFLLPTFIEGQRSHAIWEKISTKGEKKGFADGYGDNPSILICSQLY
jgi:hypothetical protein